ncbi:MAG: HAMP domain-containing histidine kinase, partial [Chloroflexi bacterium]|nr:HAMP domain-containing histidine kinase [Chloroflexota bacterium]
ALLLAVNARRLTTSLPVIPGTADPVLSETSGTGEALGDPFPGVHLSYATVGARPGTTALPQLLFYAAALLMVLGVTGVGAFLLWRDVRREMRLGELRAQFVASVSHELKTPLTSIRMFADTLRMARGIDESTRGEYLDTIINESERLTRLLNNVLDFSRIEQERRTYRLQPAHLPDVLRAAVRTLEYPLAQDGFELRLEIDDGLPPVNADADAVQQAVLNLLTNAIKYSGTSRRIDLSLAARGGHATIAVTDHGLGVTPQDRPRLFERFYRARTPENQYIPGTGLGLTIVEHIVSAHGGTVTCESTPGGGSTFSMTLPLITAPAIGAPAMADVHS